MSDGSGHFALLGSRAMYADMTAAEMAKPAEQTAHWQQVAALWYIASELALINEREEDRAARKVLAKARGETAT